MDRNPSRSFLGYSPRACITNTSNFAGAFHRIVSDNSSYYTLAYAAPASKPGASHTVDVRVRRPGLTARARRAYTTPRQRNANPEATTTVDGDMPAALRTAVASPLPVAGLAMEVSAVPFRSEGREASVLLVTEIRGRELRFESADRLAVSFAAIDTRGKVAASRSESITLAFREPTRSRVAAGHLRTINRLDLAPGRYQIRVAAHDAGSARAGSVLYDLDVPDFEAAPLSMSGVVLTAVAASQHPTLRGDQTLQRVLPGHPVTARAFSRNDALATFVEVYDRQRAAHTVTLETVVNGADGSIAFSHREERQVSASSGKRGSFDYSVRIPLKELPGAYVLRTSATSTLERAPVARQLPFTIE